MAEPTERVCELFIDESGEFEPDRGAVQLCGMLVDAAPDLASTRNLRPALRLAFPAIAYPPHAAQLTTVPGYVGCWVRAGAPSEPPAPLGEFARCRDLLRDEAPQRPEIQAWRAFAARTSHKLAPAEAWAAQAWLQRAAPGEFARASEFVARRAHVFRNMMDAFVRARSGRLVLVGSHELEPHPDPSLPEFVGRHRYLVLLVALLERVVSLVGGEAPKCTVRVRAGSRWLEPKTPRDGPREGEPLELTRIHLQEAAEAARRAVGELGAAVRFECYPPECFDASVHPGIVVADFASHGLFRLLNEAAFFGEVDGQARRQLGASCSAHAAWFREASLLPAIAANGPPRGAILAALSGRSAPIPDRTRPGWAGDQARTWTWAIMQARGRRT